MTKPVFIHLPKTGGNTIRDTFGSAIVSRGHRPASQVPEMATTPWSFGFVRDPWDRMVSWFYWSKKHNARPEDFPAWVMNQGSKSFRTAEYIFAGPDGDPLVSVLYRFEDFLPSLDDIARRLGVKDSPGPRSNLNLNRHKPTKLDTRALYYTTAVRDRVAELGAWEIARFGYEFASPSGT